jgi:hypothetical protein
MIQAEKEKSAQIQIENITKTAKFLSPFPCASLER